MKKLFSAIIAVIFCLIVQFSIIIAQSPTPTPNKSMTDGEASKILDDLQSGKMKIDPCLGASIGGFVTFTKTTTGMKTNLRDAATLREIVSDCDVSLKSKDSYERTQQKTYLRGMARYYLIRGLNSSLNEAFNNLSKLSEAEIQQASVDLKIASDGAIESAENNLAYLYSGEMLALLAVKRKDKSLYNSALAQWRSAEDQSMILKPEQAASSKKSVAENRLALETAWKSATATTKSSAASQPKVESLTIKPAVSASPTDIKSAAEAVSRALVFINKEDHKSALIELNKAVKLDSQNSRAWYLLGGVHLLQKSYKEGIAEIDKAIAINPSCVDCFINRGYAYQNIGDTRQAIADATKALELDPKSTTAKENLEFYKSELNPGTIDAATIPKKEEIDSTPQMNSSLPNSVSSSEMSSIRYYYDEQMTALNSAVRRFENGRRCSALEEVKSIAWDLKTFLEQKVRARQYGNIRLSVNEAQKLESWLYNTEDNIKTFARLSCN